MRSSPHVTGSVPLPAITFAATPSTVPAGHSSTLSWTTTNATSVSIDNGIGSQALYGSVAVSPTVTTTYTLTAIGPGGATTKQVTVAVNPPPSITLSASPTSIVPGQASTPWTTMSA